jgi:hypothetical protein
MALLNPHAGFNGMVSDCVMSHRREHAVSDGYTKGNPEKNLENNFLKARHLFGQERVNQPGVIAELNGTTVKGLAAHADDSRQNSDYSDCG